MSGSTQLHGQLFRPENAVLAAVVLHGATGVPQRFYRHFARWLSDTHDLAVMTYDYRGMGASAQAHLRDCPAMMSDWGVWDQAAAQAKLETLFPDAPLWVVGHSLGALCLPFQSGATRVERLFAISAGIVHWTDHPWPYRSAALSFWFAHGPAATAALGYLPKWSGVGAALPGPVFWQWRRWCITRGFYERDIGGPLPTPDWQAFKGRARLVAVADDDIAPPAAVWRLAERYPNADITKHVLHPEACGLRKAGHIQILGKSSASAWPEVLGDI